MFSQVNNITNSQSIEFAIQSKPARSPMLPKEFKKKEWESNSAYLAYCYNSGRWETRCFPQYGMRRYMTACRDVSKVFSYREDVDMDGGSWMMSGKLTDGSAFYFIGGCDYSGFDCQGGGAMYLAPSWESLFDNLTYHELMQFVDNMSEDNTLALTKSLIKFIHFEEYREQLRSKLKDIFSLLKK